MVRSELVEKLILEIPELTRHEVERAVSIVFEQITCQVAEGNRTELRGFGVFEARARKARDGRNPATGEVVAVEAKNVPFFKAGRTLRSRVNGQ